MGSGTQENLKPRPKADSAEPEEGRKLRRVLKIADAFLGCATVDEVCRRAVELARERLGIERCAIFLLRRDAFHGTYGTDLSGRTTDEHCLSFVHHRIPAKIKLAAGPGEPYWYLVERDLTTLEGTKLESVGFGWNVVTPIKCGETLLGQFYNDTAISRAPVVPEMQNLLGLLCSLVGNIIGQKYRAERLRRLAEATAQTTGCEFHHQLVRTLAEIFEVRAVFVSEALDDLASRCRILAAWDGDHFETGTEYPTAPTPCSDVYRHGSVFFPSGLADRFPEDTWVTERGLESYYGIAFHDREGKVLGHLELMDDLPMAAPPLDESLLEILAGRAAAELERIRSANILSDREDTLIHTSRRLEKTLVKLEEAQSLVAKYKRSSAVASGTAHSPVSIPEDAASTMQSDSGGEKMSSILKVLVVDDEAPIREIISSFLEIRKYQVTTAEDGKQALETFRAGEFDLVITDLAMPEMSGAELAEAVRNEGSQPPIILVTGFGDSVRNSETACNCFDAVLSKPILSTKLFAAIDKIFP